MHSRFTALETSSDNDVSRDSLRRKIAHLRADRTFLGFVRHCVGTVVYRANTVASAYGYTEPNPLATHSKDLGRSVILRMEGFMSGEQASWFRSLLAENKGIKNIAEIGFNGGHSSFNFLDARPDTDVVSFDLGSHDYVKKAKDLIDGRFPDRHQLIIGDSADTVPNFVEETGRTFDLIFVDGGHDYQTARQDILNCRALAAPDALLVVDDYLPDKRWGAGPALAYDEAIQQGLVAHVETYSAGGRAWTLSKYSQRQLDH